ncbi:MAG: transporter [Planctomycetaceae bacterium]|nr:transporter [Planctomycetaceae bacterium]
MHRKSCTSLSLLLISFAGLAWTSAALAQEAEPEHIETDRDSFTPATVTAGNGRLIVESGYSFIDNRSVPETHSLPELIARYGLNDWFELRIGSNYEVGGASNSISGGGGDDGDFDSAELETEAKVTYGFKAALTEQDGWMPRSIAIVQGATPTSGVETATHAVGTYAWGWELGEIWLWDSAIRYGDGKTEEDNFDRWAPSTVLKCGVAEQWNAHIEYFGIFTDGRSDELTQSYVSPGLHYLVTPDFEVGVRIGWGLSNDAANFFSNAGVGVQF